MEPSKKREENLRHKINYYFLVILFAGIILYQYGNGQEPEDDSVLDLYETLLLIAHVVATSIVFFIAKRFWGGEENVFGKAYLALAVGMLGNLLGWSGWFYFEIHGVENPYPYWNDLGFVVWHAGALIHLRLTIHRFRPKIGAKNWFILLSIPSTIAVFYLHAYGGAITMEHGFQFNYENFAIDFNYDGDGDGIADCDGLCFATSMFFIFVNPLMLSSAIVGYSVFKKGILGPAWLLLILGIGLTVLADVPYYYLELYGIYERAHWYTMFYFASPVIMAYALFRHKDLLSKP